MSKPRNREMSGWPVAPRDDVDDASAVAKRFAPEQADIEDAVAAAPKKRKKLEVVE
jgi:hypothetical protein